MQPLIPTMWRTCRVLANPQRLRSLWQIGIHPGQCVSDIAKATKQRIGVASQYLRDLQSRGILCIAAHPHTDKKVLSQADFTSDCCVVFGSEGRGISPEVLAACDEAVAVPMANEVDSLNVGAAAAVFLYEVQRQRKQV